MQTPDHSEFRHGWPVVLACFWVAVFSWGFGFYGQSVYLAALTRSHGWPAALISGATTAFYLLGALLMPSIQRVLQRIGPRAMLMSSVVLMGVGACGFSAAQAPWHMFAAAIVMAVGWAGASGPAIATTLALWFDRRRALAISLALNGASASGFTIAPLLVRLSPSLGLSTAVRDTVLASLALLLPLIAVCVRQPRIIRHADATAASRRHWLSERRFWSLALPFALAIAAQVGLIIHMVALLLPGLGAGGTSLAVSLASGAAMAGRLGLGVIVDRLPQRPISALCFASQACGVALLLALPDQPAALYAGVVLFGLSVGNVITLPAILAHREFPAAAFGLVVGLSGAIGQFTLALAPGLFGLLHDAAGGYAPVLVACIALQLLAAGLVLRRPR